MLACKKTITTWELLNLHSTHTIHSIMAQNSVLAPSFHYLQNKNFQILHHAVSKSGHDN
jgi:hypothetical protein